MPNKSQYQGLFEINNKYIFEKLNQLIEDLNNLGILHNLSHNILNKLGRNITLTNKAGVPQTQPKTS